MAGQRTEALVKRSSEMEIDPHGSLPSVDKSSFYDIHGLIKLEVDGSQNSVAQLLDRDLDTFKQNGIKDKPSDISLKLGRFPDPEWKPKGLGAGDDLLYDKDSQETIVFSRASQALSFNARNVKYVIAGDIRKPDEKVSVYLPNAGQQVGSTGYLRKVRREILRRKWTKACFLALGGNQLENAKLTEEETYNLRAKILEPFLYYRLPYQGHSLIHSSVLSIGDSGIVFFGPSGVGKSTVAIQMISQGMSFLADDLAIVSEKGRVLSYPKRIKLEEHFALVFPDLVEKACSQFVGFQRSVFKRLVRSNPSYLSDIVSRMKMSEIFEEVKVPQSCSLDAVVKMKRGSSSEPMLTEIERDGVGKMLASEVFWEFNAASWRPLRYVCCPSYASGDDLLGGMEKHHVLISTILDKAVRNARAFELVLPAKIEGYHVKRITDELFSKMSLSEGQ